MYIRLVDNDGIPINRSKDPYWEAYRQQRKNAKRRGIPFLLTFTEWKNIWDESGKWGQRGVRSGNYVMCRTGDKGCYEIHNVFIGSVYENHSVVNLGRPMTEAAKQKISEANKNRPWPIERILRGESKRGPMSEGTKKKLSDSNKGKILSPERQRVMLTPYGFYKSGADAARAFGVTVRTAHQRCQSTTDRFAQWRYV